MAHALWKGAITFGLVNIPVELYPAEDRKSFKFSMLDKRVGFTLWRHVTPGYQQPPTF